MAEPRIIDADGVTVRAESVSPNDPRTAPPRRGDLPAWVPGLLTPHVVRPAVGVVVGLGLLGASYVGGFFGLWACFCTGVIGFVLGSMSRGGDTRV